MTSGGGNASGGRAGRAEGPQRLKTILTVKGQDLASRIVRGAGDAIFRIDAPDDRKKA
jgi:hypothetical protein